MFNMLVQLSMTFKKYANGWLILALLAGAIFFNTVILPKPLAKLQAASGGIGPLDLQFFYTAERAYSMVASYGEEARAFYRRFELTGDIIYPIVTSFLLALLITWLFQRGFAPDHGMQKLNVVPVGAWLFDLLENIGIVTMLSIYPATHAALAWITGLFTLIKWLFAGVTIILILIGLVMALKNGFKRQDTLPLRKLEHSQGS
jgi:hypothetical protein